MNCELCGKPIDSHLAIEAAVGESIKAKARLLQEARLLAVDANRPHDRIIKASKDLVLAEEHAEKHRNLGGSS